MSDPVTISRSAREALARGLSALQADPSVPPQLVELAAPIAQAMGALHQIEKGAQLMPHADVALNHVRGALAKLQGAPAAHPAVGAALEAVAGSLTSIHSLSTMARGGMNPPTSPQPQTTAPIPNAPSFPQPAQQAPPAHYPQQAPAAQYPQHAPPPQQARPAPAPAPAPMVARDPFAAPPPAAVPHGMAAPAPAPAMQYQAAPAPAGQPATPSMPVPAPPAGDFPVFPAELGTHSPTNFYKGLSGNDIIDHGGIFVATYIPPKVGTAVRLKISLPGGYEFEANGAVKWVREQGGDAPPGFGAQFTQIAPEARQLVYRYVRNREPIFHDDF